MSDTLSTEQRVTQAIDTLNEYVDAPEFPCVGAKSAFHKGRIRFGCYGVLGEDRNAISLCDDLRRFSLEFPNPGSDPVSFVATFEDPSEAASSEGAFGRAMWRQLQGLHEHDRLTFGWDATVSADPESSDFSFSIGGRAFFVVGLHPRSSRLARRSPMPCMVFNFHDQFESLRASGKYAGMQRVIRDRDVKLQGDINPMLAAFGDRSEARQYSGVAVDESWRCPFHALEAEDA